MKVSIDASCPYCTEIIPVAIDVTPKRRIADSDAAIVHLGYHVTMQNVTEEHDCPTLKKALEL